MTTERFANKYRIQSTRLQGYDYGSTGWYFVTICTQDRECSLGRIVKDPQGEHVLEPSRIGRVAIDYWMEIPEHYPFVELDEFVVMPNHVHGIIGINKPLKLNWEPNRFGVQSQNLAAIIRGYKSTVKRFANQAGLEFAWQSRYHDRIVRDFDELDRIRIYILNNPSRWKPDDNVDQPDF